MSTQFPHILFLFIDGIGLGPAGSNNPFARLQLPGFSRWTQDQPWTTDAQPIAKANHLFQPIDANLETDGLPQSGTGQASLFTGINGAQLAGRHFGPFPHSATKPALTNHSLFKQVKEAFPEEDPVAFANAYPAQFFKHARKRQRWTVTTFACQKAGVRLRRHKEWLKGKAVTADLTGQAWQRHLSYDLAPIAEEEAAQRLVGLCTDYRLTVFEYYLTDKAGHGRSKKSAQQILRSVDRLLEALYNHLDPAKHLLILTSDHGNLEDLSTKSHTRNPVPFIAYGHRAFSFQKVKSILDVTPQTVATIQTAATCCAQQKKSNH